MRLRYFHVENLPPLSDVTLTFGHEEILGRPGAIHFVVGVNGSGKSRLLQAIADVFLSLESRTVPPFPVTLAWDIGATDKSDNRTLILHSRYGLKSRAVLMESLQILSPEILKNKIRDFDNIHFEGPTQSVQEALIARGGFSNVYMGSFPGSTGFLPRVMLSYTSGNTRAWESLFGSHRRGLEEDFAPSNDAEEFSPHAISLNPRPNNITEASIGLHVTHNALRLAMIVMAISQAAEEFESTLKTDELRQKFLKERDESDGGQRISGFRGILDTIGYLWPVTLKIHVEEPDSAFPGGREDESERRKGPWEKLIGIATSRLSEPGMPDDSSFANPRSLFFDLRAMYRGEETDGENNTARAILNALGGTAFLAFKTIHEWHLRGLINLHDMQLVLRKHGVENLLLLDSLSDGERVFVGRMALFYLLRDEKDALVLLDEPETHFNDFWKRQMVDIVDDSLGDDPNDVVLTTHSSIALTDAFTSEVTVLQNDNGQVTANQPRIQTFGASPTEILQDVFNAPDSIGQRASEYLDMVLVLAENPEDIELWWNNESNDTLAKFIKSVENAYRARRVPAPSESDLQKRIPEVLRALGELSSKNIAIAIELLYNKLGSGYYRFEFHQRLIAIRNNTDLE